MKKETKQKIKKAIMPKLIKVLAVLVQAVPIGLLFVSKLPVMVDRVDKTVSVVAVMAVILICGIFRDAAKKFIQAPSMLKTSIILVIFSYIAISLGQTFFILGLVSLGSAIAAIPFNIWATMAQRDYEESRVIDKLGNALKGGNLNGDK